MSSLSGVIKVKVTGWMKGQLSQSLSSWTCLQPANIQLHNQGADITSVHTCRHPDPGPGSLMTTQLSCWNVFFSFLVPALQIILTMVNKNNKNLFSLNVSLIINQQSKERSPSSLES